MGTSPLPGKELERGAKVAAAGAPERLEVRTQATFSAKRERVKPQTIQIAAYAKDTYLDVRQPTLVLRSPHFEPGTTRGVVDRSIGKWFRNPRKSTNAEKQLHATNKELRDLPAEKLDEEANRRKIENQAAAEKNNAKRLNNLTKAGRDLVKQATRNEEFDAERLELMAQMLEQLQDIAENRMPNVADLLKDAANAPESQPSEQKPGEKEMENLRIHLRAWLKTTAKRSRATSPRKAARTVLSPRGPS